MAEFEIKLSELEQGGKSYDLPVAAAWLDRALDLPDLHAAPDADGRVRFHASLSGNDVIVHGRLTTAVVAPCARCLADTRIAVNVDLTALFTRKSDARSLPVELELTPEDLDRETYSGDVVVLDVLIREQVVLEVPMQVVCREDCPGLEVPAHVRGPASLTDAPVVDGKTIDPRLAPLLALSKATLEQGAVSDAQPPKKNKKRAS